MKNNGANIDVLSMSGGGNLVAHGGVAMRLMQSGFNVNALRTCDVLRKDEWKLYDTKLVEIARKRLVGVSELLSRGLRYDIPNGLGVTQIDWEQAGDFTDAEVTMSGLSDSQRDRMIYTLKSMPLPIIHKDFQVNLRALEASRRSGQPLDTANGQMAMKVVMEKIESLLFNGVSGLTVDGYTIPGLTTESNRNTGSTTAAWDSTTTGEEFVDDFLAMINKLVTDNMYGPYGVFVDTTTYTRMGDDYKTNSDKTILQRLLEIPGIQFIKPTSDLSAGVGVMVQLDQTVVEEVVGMEPTILQWDSHGGMVQNFKVMAIMVPRVRSTKSGQSGIVHYS